METFIYKKRFHTPVYRTVLPSGAEVWTCPLASRMVSIETVFPFGAMEDGEHKGIAHFLEHLMLRGPDADGIHPLSRPLIRKGCEYNAATAWFHMSFSQSGLAECVCEMLEAMSRILQVPAFTVEQVRQERSVILAEIQQRSRSNRWDAWVYPRMYPENFPTYTPIAGTPESVEAIGFEDLQKYAYKQLRFERCLFVASGGLTHDMHLEQITRLYPELSKPGDKRRRPKTLKYVPPSGIYVLGSQNGKTSIDFHYQRPVDGLDDIHHGIALQALLDSRYGILYDLLRSQRRLVYSMSAESYAWPFTSIYFEIPAQEKDFAEIQQLFFETIKRIRDNGIQKHVIDQVLVRRRIHFATRNEVFKRSMAIGCMHRMWFEDDTEDLDYESLVLSTTPEQVHEACIKYLDPDKMGVVKCVRPDI